ncbi:MAG: hypothetical protein FJ149_01570 [Euryarchaeota archaeon]|nr:hypothetical protein [Euryarchaeota archaeon]
MKRTVAALLTLLLVFQAQPPARAVPTPELWETDLTLLANRTLPATVDLVIGPGVNISLEPDLDASPFQPLFLSMAGGFEVRGTAERPVRFLASNRSHYLHGSFGGYINITGNGEPQQIQARNCSFENLVLILNSSAGLFRDCTFDTCYLYISDSPVRFDNCTFAGAPASIFNPASLNETVLSGCAIDASGRDGRDPFWGHSMAFPAIRLSGYTRIEGCTIRGYGTGIQSSSGVPFITGCSIRDCGTGIELYTTDPDDTPVVEGCVIYDCSQLALEARGNLHLRDCVLANSTYGLVLYRYGSDPLPNWTLSGNRIYGNSQYGLSLYGSDVDPGDTLFDDGAGGTNGAGRVEKTSDLQVFLSNPEHLWPPDLVVNVTDAFGDPVPIVRSINNSYEAPFLTEYSIDNFGTRLDHYPYTVRAGFAKTARAEWRDIFCETAVPAGTANVTLRLAVLSDLVIREITLDPPFPRGGDWLAISCKVNNTGPSPSNRVPVLFTLDGEPLDRAELFPVAGRSFSFARAQDWKARPGTHTVTVRIDPDNELEENDEANNNLTFNFTVRAPPGPQPAGPSLPLVAGAMLVALVACAAALVAVRRRSRKGGT